MFSEEQRRVAIETFIRCDHSYADTVAELGYPSRATLRLWWREYESAGEMPKGKGTRQSKHADEQMGNAVDCYLEHGRSLSRTMRALGYPKSRQTLGEWIDELAPGRRKLRGPSPKRGPAPSRRGCGSWPNWSRGRAPRRRLPRGMACRERRPTLGAGR